MLKNIIVFMVLIAASCSGNFIGGSDGTGPGDDGWGTVVVGSITSRQDGIHIKNIQCDEAVSYKVNWKLSNRTDWNIINSYPDNEVIIPVYGNVNDSVDIEIYAVNSNNEMGKKNWTPMSPVWPLRFFELRDAINIKEGSGIFNDNGNAIGNQVGMALVPGIDFSYGESFIDYFDTGTSGFFADDSIMRIVIDGKNISSDTGMGLIPYVVDMENHFMSPPANVVYVDPVSGRFCLPRPSYWNKFENTSLSDNHEIGEEQPEYAGEPHSYSGKFGNAIGAGPTTDDYQVVLYPFGYNHAAIPKGTISCWINVWGTVASHNCEDYLSFLKIHYGSVNSGFMINFFGLDDGSDGDFYNMYVYYDDQSENYNEGLVSGWHHVYAVWDSEGNLSGGTTFKFYVDGVEKFSTSNSLMPSVNNTLAIMSFVDDRSDSAGAYIDNLKIWKHVVRETPDWVYEIGAGYEDALHIIYGRGNGYRPDALDIDVGCILANP